MTRSRDHRVRREGVASRVPIHLSAPAGMSFMLHVEFVVFHLFVATPFLGQVSHCHVGVVVSEPQPIRFCHCIDQAIRHVIYFKDEASPE